MADNWVLYNNTEKFNSIKIAEKKYNKPLLSTTIMIGKNFRNLIMNERDENDLFAKFDLGIKRGLAKAREEHKQSGQSISVWQDGRIVEDPLFAPVDSIVLFLDILGYKTLLENEEDFKNLFLAIKNIRRQNTQKFQIKYRSDNSFPSMEAIPIMTSFSDCIVLSIPVDEIKEPCDIGHAVQILLSYTQQIADSLMAGGFILRGGLTRGIYITLQALYLVKH